MNPNPAPTKALPRNRVTNPINAAYIIILSGILISFDIAVNMTNGFAPTNVANPKRSTMNPTVKSTFTIAPALMPAEVWSDLVRDLDARALWFILS